MFRQMVKTVIAMVVIMTITTLSGCEDSSQELPAIQINPTQVVSATNIATTAVLQTTASVVSPVLTFIPDGKDGCGVLLQKGLVGKMAAGIPYDSRICIQIGTGPSEGAINVLMDNPRSFAERNLWVESAGAFVKSLGKSACGGSNKVYLALVTTGPLYEEFKSTGDPTKAVQTDSRSTPAPSFCTSS